MPSDPPVQPPAYRHQPGHVRCFGQDALHAISDQSHHGKSAEILNRSLRTYRSDSCMYITRGVDCLVSADEEGFLFRFLGGEPGWQQQTPPQPTLETEVLVSIDGEEILDVPYNGPKR